MTFDNRIASFPVQQSITVAISRSRSTGRGTPPVPGTLRKYAVGGPGVWDVFQPNEDETWLLENYGMSGNLGWTMRSSPAVPVIRWSDDDRAFAVPHSTQILIRTDGVVNNVDSNGHAMFTADASPAHSVPASPWMPTPTGVYGTIPPGQYTLWQWVEFNVLRGLLLKRHPPLWS